MKIYEGTPLKNAIDFMKMIDRDGDFDVMVEESSNYIDIVKDVTIILTTWKNDMEWSDTQDEQFIDTIDKLIWEL